MGKPNVALFGYNGLFSMIEENTSLKIMCIVAIIIFIAIPLLLFLKTQKGLRFRAVGLNPNFAQRQSINLTSYTFLGLFMGNALCGLAGSIMVQIQGYADIGMGIGIVIHALAALMIGESIVGTQTLTRQTIAPIIGALIYQQIQGLSLTLGLAPSDLKFLTGAIILCVIAMRR
jgi:putative ABC transport system permease protein